MQWRPHFHELFHRMQLCVNAIIENSLGQSDSSDADSTGNADRFLNLKYSPPRVSFYFRDTLPILRAVGCHIADGCARLKCLARCSNFGVGWWKRAHRALEDTVVLLAVVHHCASTLCLTPAVLLCSFVCKSDVNAALAACSFVCLHIVHCCDKYIFLLTQVRASFALNKKTKHKYDIIVLLCCEAF